MDSLWETNSGQEGAKFCVRTSTYLLNFPRKLDIQLCIIQQYNSQQLINRILAGFCTKYLYASTFSYNIFMSSWNHIEFEVSCRSISWSIETSRVTGLFIPVFLYQRPSKNPKEHSRGFLGPGRYIVSNHEANTKRWLPRLHVFLQNIVSPNYTGYTIKNIFRKFFNVKISKKLT